MKTKNLVLTAMAVFVAATGFATQLPTMNVIPVQNEKALVAFETMSPANFELSLKNQRGETIYYKKSEEPAQAYKLVFDLNDLEDGNYQVNLKHGNCQLSRQITVLNRSYLKVGEEIRMFSPYYKFENNTLQISYLNNSQKNVFLNIFRDGQYVTGKKLGKEMCIQKALDFSKLEEGTYDVVLTNNSNEFQFTVQK
jgi:YbbR domain-containing protein